MLKIGQIGECVKRPFIDDLDTSSQINFSDYDVIFVDLKSLNDELESPAQEIHREPVLISREEYLLNKTRLFIN